MRNADLYNWNIDSLSENIISTLPVPCKEVFLPYRRKTSISRKVRKDAKILKSMKPIKKDILKLFAH